MPNKGITILIWQIIMDLPMALLSVFSDSTLDLKPHRDELFISSKVYDMRPAHMAIWIRKYLISSLNQSLNAQGWIM